MPLDIQVDFNAKTAQFEKAVSKLNGNLDKFKTNTQKASSLVGKFVGVLGTIATVNVFARSIKGLIDFNDQLQKASLRLKSTVTDVAGLKGLAAEADVSFRKFSIAIQKAQVQLSKNAQAFKNIGIESTDARQLILEIAAVYQSLNSEIDKTRLLNDVFGESGTRLRTIFEQNITAIDNTIDRYGELSGASKQSTDKAAEFNDQLNELAENWTGVKNRFFTPLIATLNDVAKGWRDLVGLINDNTRIRDAIKDYTLDELNLSLNRYKANLIDLREEYDKAGKGRQTQLSAEIRAMEGAIQVQEKRKKQLEKIATIQSKVNTEGFSGLTGSSSKGGKADKKSPAAASLKAFNEEQAQAARITQQNLTLRERVSIKLDEASKLYNKNKLSLETLNREIARNTDLLNNQPFVANDSHVQQFDQFKQRLEGIRQGLRTPEQAFADGLKDLRQFKGSLGAEDYGKAVNDLRDSIFGLPDDVQQSSDLMQGSINTLAQGMTHSFQHLFFQPFDVGVKGMVKSFLASLQQMAAAAAAQGITNLVVSGLSAAAGSFGGSGGYLSSTDLQIATSGYVLHNGGIAGLGGTTRQVSPAVFAGAERFHNGGLPGLRRDEVPAILQKGERVLPKNHTITSNSNDIKISTHVEVSGGLSENSRQLGQMVNAAIKQKLVDEKRPGGLLA